MEIIEVKNLKELLVGTKVIGYGTTCICFLLRDNSVFKLYLNTYRKVELFDTFNMFEHLKMLNNLGNDTYVSPEKIVILNNKIIGYSMKYINTKTLAKMSKDIYINDVLNKINKLYEDTYLISKNNFDLRDIHRKNILYQNRFYVIDLDHGYINLNLSEDLLLKCNISGLLLTIIGAIFGENIFEGRNSKEMIFFDDEINTLYKQTIHQNHNKIFDLFGCIKEKVKNENPTINELRRVRKKIYKKEDNYYGK